MFHNFQTSLLFYYFSYFSIYITYTVLYKSLAVSNLNSFQVLFADISHLKYLNSNLTLTVSKNIDIFELIHESIFEFIYSKLTVSINLDSTPRNIIA